MGAEPAGSRVSPRPAAQSIPTHALQKQRPERIPAGVNAAIYPLPGVVLLIHFLALSLILG